MHLPSIQTLGEKKSVYNSLYLNMLKAKAIMAGKDHIVQIYLTVIIGKTEHSWKVCLIYMGGFYF